MENAVLIIWVVFVIVVIAICSSAKKKAAANGKTAAAHTKTTAYKPTAQRKYQSFESYLHRDENEDMSKPHFAADEHSSSRFGPGYDKASFGMK